MNIKIENVLKVAKKSFIFILIAFVIFYAAGYYFTRTSAVTTYYSYAEIMIQTKALVDKEYIDYIGYENGLSKTYIQMLNTYSFYESVCSTVKEMDKSGALNVYNADGTPALDENGAQKRYLTADNVKILSSSLLKGSTTILNKQETAILRITYYDYTRTLSPAAVQLMTRIISETIDDFLGTEMNIAGVRVLEDARPAAASSIPARDNSLIAGIVGAALVFAIAFIRDMFDVRIKNAEDLTSNYNIPVLGVVPYFSTSRGSMLPGKYSKKYGYGKKYGYAKKYAYGKPYTSKRGLK